MPREIRIAVDRANADDDIHVIILQGAGRAFCSGYDFAEADVDTPCTQSMPWDPMVDYRAMKGFTDDFFSLWRSYKPTLCKVHGFAVAGGSDIALCCDLVVMAERMRRSVTCRRASGAARPPQCGSIASAPRKPSACC